MLFLFCNSVSSASCRQVGLVVVSGTNQSNSIVLWMCNSIRIYHFEEGGGGAGLFEPVGNCSLRSIRGDSIFRTPPCSFVFVGLLFIVKNFI